MTREFSERFRARYRVLRELGSGGMGRVLEAVQSGLGRRVAIKVLRPEHFDDAESRGRFVEEARILSRLSHPNVVALFDADLEDECPYLVMEFVDGPTLQQIVRERGRMELAEALLLARDLVGGLEYLHASGVLHRDLKPDNILVKDRETPKMADFGLARRLGGARLTADGFTVGTPMYMAPEQINGAEPGPPADVYSFGMVLYHMVTGSYPFPASRSWDVLPHKLELNARALRNQLRGFPEALPQLLSRCLAPAPEDRPASASELASELARLELGGSRAARAAAPRGDAASQRTQKLSSVHRTIGLAAGACLCLGAAAFHWNRAAPMSTLEAYAPAELAVEPLPGAALVRWRSALAYPSRVAAGGRVAGGGDAESNHRVRIEPIAWAMPPEASVLFPDGSRSLPFRLAAHPVPIRPTVVRSGASATFAVTLPEPSALRLTLHSGGKTLWEKRLPESVSHRCELPAILPDFDYDLDCTTPGTGILPASLPTIDLPSPRRVRLEFQLACRTFGLSAFERELVKLAGAGASREKLRDRMTSGLKRLGWREHAARLAPAVAWSRSAARADPCDEIQFVSILQDLLAVPLAFRVAGLTHDLGVDGLLGETWSQSLGEPPPGGVPYERRNPAPRKLVGKFIREVVAATSDEKPEIEHEYTFDVPRHPVPRKAFLTFRVLEARPDSYLHIWLQTVCSERLGRDLTFVLGYPRDDRPQGEVSLTQRIDPAVVPPGRCRVRIQQATIPGCVATHVFVLGAKLTLQ